MQGPTTFLCNDCRIKLWVVQRKAVFLYDSCRIKWLVVRVPTIFYVTVVRLNWELYEERPHWCPSTVIIAYYPCHGQHRYWHVGDNIHRFYINKHGFIYSCNNSRYACFTFKSDFFFSFIFYFEVISNLVFSKM